MWWKNFMIWKTKSKIQTKAKSKVYTKYKTMLCYCLKCRKNTQSKNPEVIKTKNGRIILLSKCSACDGENSKFLKEEEAKDY